MINFILLFFILFFNALSYSQQANTIIEKSKEKIIINSKIYYLHTIKSGQTLYSISKAYNVTIDDILTANPGLNPSQIKEGTSIKIPENNQQKNENINETNNDYIFHKVKQGETLYFLSKKYNISIDDIIKNNPGLETLKVDQIVKIPRQIKNIKTDTLKYVIYELNKKDTLYTIAKRYNTSVSEIIELNPELKNGIKKGLKIKIPIKEDTSKYIKESFIDCNSKPEIKKELRFAILISKIGNFNDLDNSNTEKIIRFYNFYKGILLALDSIKNEGKSVSLKIFEVEEKYNTNITNNIIKFNPDIIINFNAKIDSSSCSVILEKNIPIIYLLDSDEKIYKFSNIIEVIFDKYNYLEYVFNYIQNKYYNKKINLIIINDKHQNKNLYLDSLLKNKKKLENLKIDIINDSILLNVQKSLDSLNKNIIFINSVNEGLVSILLSRLSIQQKIYDINVIGLPDWLYFNKVETEVLHKINTEILTPFYIDYNNKNVKNFLYKNTNIFGYEPPRKNFSDILTFLGFDIVFLSKDILFNYVDIRCLKEHIYNGLLTSYLLFKNEQNIISNKSYYIISFEKDYTIKKELKTIETNEKILSRKNKNNF